MTTHICQIIYTPIINTNYWHSCYQHTVHFCLSIKGHNFVKKPCRVMVLIQSAALVMMDKHMKFHKIWFNTYTVIAKVNVCHNNDNNDDYNDDDIRVMTIPQLFSLKNSWAKKRFVTCYFFTKIWVGRYTLLFFLLFGRPIKCFSRQKTKAINRLFYDFWFYNWYSVSNYSFWHELLLKGVTLTWKKWFLK